MNFLLLIGHPFEIYRRVDKNEDVRQLFDFNHGHKSSKDARAISAWAENTSLPREGDRNCFSVSKRGNLYLTDSPHSCWTFQFGENQLQVLIKEEPRQTPQGNWLRKWQALMSIFIVIIPPSVHIHGAYVPHKLTERNKLPAILHYHQLTCTTPNWSQIQRKSSDGNFCYIRHILLIYSLQATIFVCRFLTFSGVFSTTAM